MLWWILLKQKMFHTWNKAIIWNKWKLKINVSFISHMSDAFYTTGNGWMEIRESLLSCNNAVLKYVYRENGFVFMEKRCTKSFATVNVTLLTTYIRCFLALYFSFFSSLFRSFYNDEHVEIVAIESFWLYIWMKNIHICKW